MGATELKDEATKEQRGDGAQPLRPDEILDPNEIRKMLEKAEPGYYRTLFLTAYLTGMRSGELFALRWSDVELKGIDAETGKESSRRRILVCRSLSWARVKKDDGPGPSALFFAQNDDGCSHVAYGTRGSAPALETRMSRRASMTWSFRRQTDSRCIAARRCVTACGRLPRSGGIRRVNKHSLHHSFASALIMAGAPVTEVQSLLGHSSPAVTLKVYSHWFKNVETDSVYRLAKSLTTGSKNLPE